VGRGGGHPVADERVAGHGTAVPRGQDVEPEADPTLGRFGRMFPRLAACVLDDRTIDALAGWMGDDGNRTSENIGIPAGFTYLGQFIDHDITFDPTPLAARTRANGRMNFRTPRFDLDSVYGAGPLVQPFLYDWKDSEPPGARLLVGRGRVPDLPRNRQGRALIGDARNDENVIVAQLHLLFIRFHNAVVDHLAGEGTPADELFDRARRLVRRHYQWIVVREFLPTVVGADMADEVITPVSAGTPTVRREFFTWKREPHIPREFSGAAFRFGHSMVRPEYGVKQIPPDAEGLHQIPIFPELQGFRRIPERLVIDWERFFELPERAPPLPLQVQFSMQIDTSISPPLFKLPDGEPDLPRRNLVRGRKLELPSGQAVARRMHVPRLGDDELQLGAFEDDQTVQVALRRAAPLWFYILCEAGSKRGDAGAHLGPVGGRIVAEVLVGLLEGDPNSFLSREPTWRPRGLGIEGDFTMADLVRFAER
jgi:hypothetical protein